MEKGRKGEREKERKREREKERKREREKERVGERESESKNLTEIDKEKEKTFEACRLAKGT